MKIKTSNFKKEIFLTLD